MKINKKYASLNGKLFPYKVNMGRAKEFFSHLRHLFVPSTFFAPFDFSHGQM